MPSPSRSRRCGIGGGCGCAEPIAPGGTPGTGKRRSIFGSYERFIGILIEHFAGRLPAWLAPTQAVVATIVSDADDYARDAVARLKAAGIRADSDLRNEKINYKVREHSLAKVPHLLVVGKREAEEGTVAIRTLGVEGQRIISLDESIAWLLGETTAPDRSVVWLTDEATDPDFAG